MDEQTGNDYARLNTTPVYGEQDTKIKDQLINPAKHPDSAFFEDLTRELRIANIDNSDKEFWMEKVRMVKELCNNYIVYDLPEPAQMLMSELYAQLNLTASFDGGFQVKRLGNTTGTNRQEITTRQEPLKR